MNYFVRKKVKNDIIKLHMTRIQMALWFLLFMLIVLFLFLAVLFNKSMTDIPPIMTDEEEAETD